MISWLRARTLLALALVLIGLVGSAAAQQTESRILGRIVDQSDAALPGVTVTVTAKSTGAIRTAVTEGDGSYVVTNLAPGAYTVRPNSRVSRCVSVTWCSASAKIETVTLALLVGRRCRKRSSVSAVAPVLDVASARIGVNVTPEEVKNLPVNGRNFANLMTLATGATSDGNGGWSSVRFNGKSNQQNYLNYDGVDGTYVWDASPGYLSATGSQFRLQTSMESVSEFRVNSGLAPAESGLGAGGNITVVTKSGTNRFTGLDVLVQARRCAGLGQQVRQQEAAADARSVRRIARWSGAANKTFFFFSYRRAAPEHGSELHRGRAERRSASPHHGRRAGRISGAGQSAARTMAVAPLLAGFPIGTVATSNPLVALATLETQAEQDESTFSFRVDQQINSNHSLFFRYLYSNGEVDTPDRTVTPRRVLRSRPRRTSSPTASRFSAASWSTRSRSASTCRRRAPARSAPPATTRSASRSRARSPRRQSMRAATPASRAAAC